MPEATNSGRMIQGFEVPRRPWWRRHWKSLAAAALALVLVGVGLRYWDEFPCGGPGNGVRLIGGQCVGITDDAHVFHDDFEEIQSKIAEENDRISEAVEADDSEAVKIAHLGTFSFGEVGPMDPGRMLRALEGAHAAQMAANHSPRFGDRTPEIQLELANVGSQQAQWEPVVDQLVPMAEDDTPLVAVTGMGVSIDSTRDIAERLSGENIPMVSSAVTADGLEHGEIPGLLRAAPSNTEYVRALREYMDGLDEDTSAALVYDENDPDLFVTTLRRAYEEHLADFTEGSAQEYRGTTVGESSTPGLYTAITMNLCTAATDTVFFAGRAPDLDDFLYALSIRSCDHIPMRVVFAVTGLSVVQDDEVMGYLEDGDISLVYASATDPRWENATPGEGAPEHYGDFLDAYREHVGDDAGAFDNGYALVNHDAVGVAARAVRLSNLREGEELPTAEEVSSQLMLLNSAQEVEAGGGTLSYEDHMEGEAAGRYVPVVELPLEGGQPLEDPYVTGD
ncbi:ABC transporter substrate-binding protein [Nocardiopsis salina]|uniref:ABC transporter substrate-binding protein n=1 Tax=Nocardiopsis salina TaxID=245836 RepID=UPI001EF9F74A|nr:ABC transporter substrate-binding protein [Nocardiopsis salina]